MQDKTNAKLLVSVYAVRNKEGQYFHAKGYGGYGKTWVEDIRKARIYPKPGPARAQVSYFSQHHPEHGVPDLVELCVTEVRCIDETARVAKSQKAKVTREARERQRQARKALLWAEQDVREATERLHRAKGE